MTRFYNYVNENDDMISLVEVYHFMEMNTLNEGTKEWSDKVSNLLKSMNIQKGPKRGLIEYLRDASMRVSKLLWYSIRYSMGDQKAKEKISELSRTKVTRSEFMNLLMKLDAVTLGVISSPIRMMDAITGWNLMDAIITDAQDIRDHARRAIESLENIYKSLTDKAKETVRSMIDKLKNLLSKEVGV